jgi:diguanylate cyclase
MVGRALDDGGLEGSALWFEITESSMMLDTSDTVATLDALHGMGVKVCVDDFGTGFSSLSYLQKFAIDRLKIDRSFVVAMEQGDESKSLVSAILAIARTLDIDVVAEGIETTVQAETLLGLGCRGAQGYLYGRPSPANTIEAMLVGDVETGRTAPAQRSAVGTD